MAKVTKSRKIQGVVVVEPQLFGDELGLRGEEPLPHLALARVRGDGAVGRNRQPAVELLRWTADQSGNRLPEYVNRSKREADNERTGTFEQRAPRQAQSPEPRV